MTNSQGDWRVFHGDNRAPHDEVTALPSSPSWRPFGRDIRPGVSRRKRRGETFQARDEEISMVNAALYLRRPLLITGKPGTGKSSLAYAVARELNLGEVLYWPITTRTTLQDGLYRYDAIGRLQAVKQQEGQPPIQPGSETQKSQPPIQPESETIGKYLTLGPLGTALLPSARPRVLLVDEIDKSDIDLPNDLLSIFEEGRFEIPELVRLEPDEASDAVPMSVRVRTAYTDEEEVTAVERYTNIQGGRVACQSFPLVILTSNGEREFPPPFLRRCLRLQIREPDKDDLERIITAHLGDDDVSIDDASVQTLITRFIEARKKGELATDQLLNALFMVTRGRELVGDDREQLIQRLLSSLESEG
ncbi:MAG: MoxR family ATPase [Leptolyngbyaceae bacterium]|nr:MoxR family ATPase [Leptolyngbyaceae bacterium]